MMFRVVPRSHLRRPIFVSEHLPGTSDYITRFLRECKIGVNSLYFRAMSTF